MIGRRRVGAIDRDDVHAGEHLIEALPIGGVQFLLDCRRDPATIVIVNFQAEGLGAARHGLADPAQPDNAEPLAPDAVTEHPGRAPAAPLAVADEHLRALGQTPRHRKNERHRHVGGIFGQHAGRVGHGDAALHRGRDVDIVDAVAEIGDELKPLTRLAEYGAIDVIGDRRYQYVGGFRSLHQLRLGHRFVIGIKPRVEQFAHAHFDAVGQPTGDHDQRLLARRHALPLRRKVPMKTRKFSPAIARFATAVCKRCSPDRRSGLLNPARRN